MSKKEQMPFKTIIKVIRLMFFGIKKFLPLLRVYFVPGCARAKMSLSRAKNIFMFANSNSIVILLHTWRSG